MTEAGGKATTDDLRYLVLTEEPGTHHVVIKRAGSEWFQRVATFPRQDRAQDYAECENDFLGAGFAPPDRYEAAVEEPDVEPPESGLARLRHQLQFNWPHGITIVGDAPAGSLVHFIWPEISGDDLPAEPETGAVVASGGDREETPDHSREAETLADSAPAGSAGEAIPAADAPAPNRDGSAGGSHDRDVSPEGDAPSHDPLPAAGPSKPAKIILDHIPTERAALVPQRRPGGHDPHARMFATPSEAPKPKRLTSTWPTAGRDPLLVRGQEAAKTVELPKGSSAQQLADQIADDLPHLMRMFPAGATRAELAGFYKAPEPRVADAVRQLFAKRKIRLIRPDGTDQHIVPPDWQGTDKDPPRPTPKPLLTEQAFAVLDAMTKAAKDGLVSMSLARIAEASKVPTGSVSYLIGTLLEHSKIVLVEKGATHKPAIYRVIRGDD